MITCPECGHRNAPGTQFCASCQAYLEWEEPEGDASATQSAPPPPTAPTTDANAQAAGNTLPRTTTWGRETAEEPRGEGGARAPQSSPPAVPPVPQHPPRPSPAAPANVSANPSPEPVASPAAVPRRPGDGPDTEPGHHEEAPTVPPQPTPTTQGPSRPSRRCPHCRAVNPADRRLCTRCDKLLDQVSAPAAAPRALPWWRRIMRPGDEHRMPAGTRPRHRTLPRPRLALPLVLLLVAGLVWFARPQLAELFDFAKDSTGKPEGLQVTAPKASSSARGHKAGAAFDKLNNRYWAPAESSAGSVPWIEASFEKPVRLRKLLITPGSSAKQDEYLKQARPSRVTLTLHTSDGERSTRKLTLKDQAGDQSFDVHGSDVERVRVTVEDAFGVRPGRRLAIAELEFFGRD